MSSGWASGPASDAGSVLGSLDDPDVRCLVVDLGSLPTREEQALVAETVLRALWDRRTDRRPILVVLDEAHNVCPAEPGDPLTALATEHAVRIAAEGRKFGLYLLVATQRPQKVHENVISQCDNLMLMRLNSAADSAFIADLLGFAPPGLIGLAHRLRPRRGSRRGQDRLASRRDALRLARRQRGRRRRRRPLGQAGPRVAPADARSRMARPGHPSSRREVGPPWR